MVGKLSNEKNIHRVQSLSHDLVIFGQDQPMKNLETDRKSILIHVKWMEEF